MRIITCPACLTTDCIGDSDSGIEIKCIDCKKVIIPGVSIDNEMKNATPQCKTTLSRYVQIECPVCLITGEIPRTRINEQYKCECGTFFSINEIETSNQEQSSSNNGSKDPRSYGVFLCLFCDAAYYTKLSRRVRCALCARVQTPVKGAKLPKKVPSPQLQYGHPRLSEKAYKKLLRERKRNARYQASKEYYAYYLNSFFLATVFGLFLLLISPMFFSFKGCGKGSSPRPLSDDQRIDRMEKEEKDLIETNEWMRKKVKADQWDKQMGR